MSEVNKATSYPIVFFGTPDFSVPSLKKLITSNLNVVGVVTQPPKKVGRHAELTKSPIQVLAEKNKIELKTPNRLNDADFISWLKKLNPKAAVLVAYGKILPKEILDIPEMGFINVHPSLLPLHRGPAPIVDALLKGDEKTGITIMKLDNKMDHGPILKQKIVDINESDTTPQLTENLANQGANLLLEALPPYLGGKLQPTPQKHEQATTHHLLKRTDGEIDWTTKSIEILRKIRAYDPWPGTYSYLNNKRIKILAATGVLPKPELVASTDNLDPGALVKLEGNLIVKTGDGFLNLEMVQLEGHAKQSGTEFINGHQSLEGTILRACKTK